MPQFTNHDTEYPFPTGGVPKTTRVAEAMHTYPAVGNIQFGPHNISTGGFFPQDSRVSPNFVDGATVPQETMDIITTMLKSTPEKKKHSHYFKNVSHLHTIDVYRVLSLFGVTDPNIAHATKKLLVAGGRGAGKDIDKDVSEAIDSLVRWQEMKKEDSRAKV
jgi:hypothetical protein